MTPRDQRAIRLGLLAVGGAIVLRTAPATWAPLRHFKDEEDGRRLLLTRARTELSELPALADTAKALSERVVALAPRILASGTTGEATAEFSALLTHLALSHQARLDRVDPVSDSTQAGDLARVTLDAVFETDVRGLAQLLGALATMAPVTELVRLKVSTGDPLAGGGGPEALRVEVRVRGWYLRKEAA